MTKISNGKKLGKLIKKWNEHSKKLYQLKEQIEDIDPDMVPNLNFSSDRY